MYAPGQTTRVRICVTRACALVGPGVASPLAIVLNIINISDTAKNGSFYINKASNMSYSKFSNFVLIFDKCIIIR